MNIETTETKNDFWTKFLTKFDPFLVFFATYFVYLLTTFPTVQTEDAGELITSAAALDIAHPPGYPIYVLLGKFFTFIIPFGSVAWRVNLMSGFFAAAAVTCLYIFLKKALKNDTVALAGSLFFAFTDLLWSQSNRAEVYSLNIFFVSLIVVLLYYWHITDKNKWLLYAALAYGLSLANHHEMFLMAIPIIAFVLIRNIKVIINPKVILPSILLFALGLSVYAYIPIRTYIAPYDNPAFIDHSGIYTWDKFINFVNRKIYGGTVPVNPNQISKDEEAEKLPAWIVGIQDAVSTYTQHLIENNQIGFVAFAKIISREYFYFPLFFFLPGLYFLFAKDWRWGIFLSLLLLFSVSGLMAIISIDQNADSFSYFSAQPFLIFAVFVLGIFMCYGFQWLIDAVKNKKMKVILTVALLFLPMYAINKNFSQNNESKNYVAYDFNKNLLESIPENGLLITTGRDNMTFPLYYLRKVEGIRPDVNLKVYYSTSPITETYLINQMTENKKDVVFLDLLPENYQKIDLKPYNFVFAYGDTSKLPPSQPDQFTMRLTRTKLDYPNNHLKGLYYLKQALAYTDKNDQASYINKFLNEVGDIQLLNFLGDYALAKGDYDTAAKAYRRSGNQSGLDLVKNKQQGNIDSFTEFNQSGMV